MSHYNFKGSTEKCVDEILLPKKTTGRNHLAVREINSCVEESKVGDWHWPWHFLHWNVLGQRRARIIATGLSSELHLCGVVKRS